MKSTYRIFNVGLLSALMILLTACPNTKPPGEEKPEDKETGMYVYELVSKGANQESFKEVVKKMAGTESREGVFSEDENRDMSYADDKQDIYFYQDAANGNLSFSRGFQKYLGAYSPSLPKPDEAEKLSMSFLRSNGMLPANQKEFKLVHSGGIRADAGPNGEVIDKMLTLNYGRNLDGIPVMGSGSKIVVNIGDKGEVTGLVHKWREVEASKRTAVMESEIHSEKEATEMFKRLVAQEYGKDADVKFEEIKLVYYDGDGKFIQPAYGAKMTVKVVLDANNTTEMPYMTFLPALKKSPEGLNLRVDFKEATEFLKKEENQNGAPNTRENMD